jgi:hypothetical protein
MVVVRQTLQADATALFRYGLIVCAASDPEQVNSKVFDDFLDQHHVKHSFRKAKAPHTWIV